MPAEFKRTTLIVEGYTELVRSFDRTLIDLDVEIRKELKRVGELVRADATARFMPYSAKSARGYRTYVSQKTVNVAQSIERTTGKHPEWGGIQMRHALLPALEARQGQIESEFKSLLDVIVAKNFGL